MANKLDDLMLCQFERMANCSIWVTTFICIFCVLLTDQAFAQQSATCRSLQAQLASVETGRGVTNSSKYRKYDRAARQQLVQIKKTERAALVNGCQLLRTNVCKRIKSSLNKMYNNLSKLQATRDSLGGSRNLQGLSRAAILRKMKRNNCHANNTQTASREKTNDRRRSLLEQIFGTKTYSDEGSRQINNPTLGQNYGTYRTLCVRSCDGYYFPISFSTTQDHFEADDQQCQQMCPGAETSLYFYPMPRGDAEQSISYRSGDPYTSLPNAFAYRKGVDSQCSCRFRGNGEQNFEEIAGQTESEQSGTPREPRIGTPVFRQDRGLDPDSYDIASGGMTLEKLAAITNSTGEKDIHQSDIRIVGPVFFPVQ